MLNIERIFESIIDPIQQDLDRDVWPNNHLNPKIRETILGILKANNITDYLKLFIVGSITTKFWSIDSDIDVTVVMNEMPESEKIMAYRKIAKDINGTKFKSFDINFFFQSKDYIETMQTLADGIYDIMNNDWIKKAPEVADSVSGLLENPKALANKLAKQLDVKLEDIEQDIEQILNYRKLDTTLIDKKLEFLKMELDDYIKTLDEVHLRRNNEFSKALEKDDLSVVEKYGSRNYLPWNIIYKYLVKWLYYKWRPIFKEKLEDNKIDMAEVKKLLVQFVEVWDKMKGEKK